MIKKIILATSLLLSVTAMADNNQQDVMLVNKYDSMFYITFSRDPVTNTCNPIMQVQNQYIHRDDPTPVAVWMPSGQTNCTGNIYLMGNNNVGVAEKVIHIDSHGRVIWGNWHPLQSNVKITEDCLDHLVIVSKKDA